ncbi:MAG: ATP-binding protein [Saccharothrix sp.]|nr:ATP-binding protein [Saccharothrix sp.]
MMPLLDALEVRVNVALTTPAAPLARLRQWLVEALAALAEDVLHDVLLVCSELVANAYDHACGPRRLRLHRVDGGARLRVEVEDADPDHLPTPGRSTAGPNRGRGLVLVDALSGHRWGVHVSPRAKTVWAEVPLS